VHERVGGGGGEREREKERKREREEEESKQAADIVDKRGQAARICGVVSCS